MQAIKQGLEVRRQRGVALVTALIFLLVVTLISVYAASTGTMEFKMAANMQDAYDSFQASEAGVAAVVALVNTGDDPFDRNDDPAPFAGITPSPLANLNVPGSVTAQVFITDVGRPCPRQDADEASSAGARSCDYYRIESEHDVASRARTKVHQGLVKTLIGTEI
jgi:hypothetical protein